METNFIFLDSGTSKVLEYLKGIKRGTIITMNDIKSIRGISYTNKRTIVVSLCNNKTLIRISRGVYYYPKYADGKLIIPSIFSIITTIAQKEGYEVCPIGEYADYLLGFRNTIPNIIVCYTNSKVKTINLKNGISIKLIHSKRCFNPFIKSIKLRILVNYINTVGIDNINMENKFKLIEYFNTINTNEITSEKTIPLKVLSFMGYQPRE